MSVICGIDEVGRGPLAGPVLSVAVILPEDFPREILDDSKKLTEKRREAAFKELLKHNVTYGMGWSWPEEIDKINIHNATLQAMKRAYEDMGRTADQVMVDGVHAPNIDAPTETVVKGDSKVAEIKAASILAKVIRDRWMLRYSWIEDNYLFEKHKGYGTKEHRQRIMEHGPSPIHRASFKVSFKDIKPLELGL